MANLVSLLTNCQAEYKLKMSIDSFHDYVLEQLATLNGVRCRTMFGGSGLYYGEQFFGILYDGRLYFKTHPDTLDDYLRYQAAVFAPSKKQVLKNYREVPADILEDAAQLTAWAMKAAMKISSKAARS